jgi:hypothetical protein
MPSAVRLQEDYSAEALRALARRSKDANQSRRLLSLAAVRDGMDRGSAAKIGGMDRQTLRDWVHRFNAWGPEGPSTTGRRVPSLVFRRSNWLSSRRSSRRVRIVRRTGSCAGVGSTSNASSPRGSASTFIRAASSRFDHLLLGPVDHAPMTGLLRHASGCHARATSDRRGPGLSLRLILG